MKPRASMLLPFLLLAGTALAQTPPAAPPMLMPTTPAPEAAPVTAPAATALPEVTIPTVAPQPLATDLPATDAAPATDASALPISPEAEATPAANATPIIIEPAVAAEAPYSFGDVPFSLFYTADQTDKMRKVLTVYENSKRNNTPTSIEVVEEVKELAPEVPKVIIEEPAMYPSFTLRSIVYRDKRDWTVWIGDMRITPKTNTQDSEIRVLGLTPTAGQFLWNPTYASKLAQRKESKAFADTKPVAHKMTKPNTAQLDGATGQVVFTLRPNQTFASAYMATFEGRMPAIPMQPVAEIDVPLDETLKEALSPTGASGTPAESAPAQGETVPATPEQPAAAAATATSLQQLYQKGKGPSNETETLDMLLKQQQNMQKFAPPGARPPQAK